MGDHDYTLDHFEAADSAAAVAYSRTTGDGRRAEWAQAFTLRDERIVHIQDFADAARAITSIRR